MTASAANDFDKAESVSTMLARMAGGFTDPVELVQHSIGRARKINPHLNAFATIGDKDPLGSAEESRRRWDEGRARPLEGVPIAIKDLIDTAGMETRYGSAAYKGHVPLADAEIVRVLRDQGAIVVGKTATHEFAWGVTTASTVFGDTRNPLDQTRIPGGSSGGAAVAIACGAVPAGIGTDTGGSVRIPASLCGVVGFKPTYGRFSTDGIFPLAPSLDHAGFMGGSVDDAARLAQALEHSPHDRTAAGRSRLGIIRYIPPVPLEPAVAMSFDRAVSAIASCHAVTEMDHGGMFEGAFPAFAGLVLTEASLGHHRRSDRQTIATKYEPETRERLTKAGPIRLEEYVVWQDFRRGFTARLEAFMDGVDFLLLPTTPCIAPKIGQQGVEIEGWSGTVREALMSYTAPFNLSGYPAISIPIGVPAGSMPCGLQIVARPHHDELLLRFAAAVEQIV